MSSGAKTHERNDMSRHANDMSRNDTTCRKCHESGVGITHRHLPLSSPHCCCSLCARWPPRLSGKCRPTCRDMSRHVANVVICLRDTVLNGHDIRKCDFATPYKSKKTTQRHHTKSSPPFFQSKLLLPPASITMVAAAAAAFPPPPSPSAAAAATAPLPFSTSTSPPPLRLRPAPVSSGAFLFSSPARRTRSLYSPRSALTTSPCRARPRVHFDDDPSSKTSRGRYFFSF